MKWLSIALICAVGIIGVETYLLLQPLPPQPPAPPVVRMIAIPPSPRPVAKRKVVARKPQIAHVTTDSRRPFVMPTGGIFSGADPQDPRIYHFNAE
jgi:hypothetical protein